jgi:hypothetical protein
MLKMRIVGSLGLGFATSVLIGLAANYLPYSQARDVIIDALAIPGALIAGLVYPQGVHTGGARYWGAAVLISNFIVYVLFWYACLRLVGYFRGHKNQYDTMNPPVRRNPG